MRSRRRDPASAFRPAGTSRLISMFALLAVLGLIYSQASKPATWKWLTGDAPEASEQTQLQTPPAPLSAETLVPGPTDENESEAADARGQFEAVFDRTPLSATEMSAYWRCMKWVRAQSFADLDRRAASDVHYAQLWEQPGKFRAKPVKLRLHIRRILEYNAPPNSAGVERVYEAWAWTDESKSHPYVIVLSELPAGMKIGNEVHEEGVFVGYFMKLMSYTAFDATRAAPLLIGRIRPVAVTAPVEPTSRQIAGSWPIWAAGAVVLTGAMLIWLRLARRSTVKPAPASVANETFLADWYGSDDSSVTPSESLRDDE